MSLLNADNRVSTLEGIRWAHNVAYETVAALLDLMPEEKRKLLDLLRHNFRKIPKAKPFVFGLGGRIRQRPRIIDGQTVRLPGRFLNSSIEQVRCYSLLPIPLLLFTVLSFPSVKGWFGYSSLLTLETP